MVHQFIQVYPPSLFCVSDLQNSVMATVNTPTNIPAFTALSFNLNGAVSDPNRKLKWIYNNFVRNKKVDILLFQEIRFNNMTDVRRAFWPYTGVLRGLSITLTISLEV